MNIHLKKALYLGKVIFLYSVNLLIFSKGSFATVHLATHKKTNIKRSIKIIDKGKFFEDFVQDDFADVDQLIKNEFEILKDLVFNLKTQFKNDFYRIIQMLSSLLNFF